MRQTAVKEMSLFSITWPLFLTFTLNVMMPIADSFFLSRVCDLAAGSVGAILSVIMTAFMAATFLTQAGVNVASQYLGGEHTEKANSAYIVTIIVGAIVSALISAFLYVFAENIGAWIGLSDAGNEFATAYLAIYGPFFFLKAIQNNLIQIIASQGHTFTNLLGVLMMNLLNIGLNYIFYNGLFGAPNLGVQGVALATVVSLSINILFSILAIRYYLRTSLLLGISVKLMRAVFKPIIRIGVPSMVEPTSYHLYQIVITALIVALGPFALTTRIYAFNLVLVTVIGSIAIGHGVQIIIAHLVGAFEFDRANKKLHLALGVAAIMAIAVMFMVWLFAPMLLGQFTNDQNVIAFGSRLILLEFISGPARAVNIIVNNALRCTGDAKIPAIVGTTMMWTIGLGCAYILGYTYSLGLWGIWIALAVDEVARAIFCYIRWRQGVWKTSGVNS